MARLVSRRQDRGRGARRPDRIRAQVQDGARQGCGGSGSPTRPERPESCRPLAGQSNHRIRRPGRRPRHGPRSNYGCRTGAVIRSRTGVVACVRTIGGRGRGCRAGAGGAARRWAIPGGNGRPRRRGRCCLRPSARRKGRSQGRFGSNSRGIHRGGEGSSGRRVTGAGTARRSTLAGAVRNSTIGVALSRPRLGDRGSQATVALGPQLHHRLEHDVPHEQDPECEGYSAPPAL
jgi:hypothetical protein